MKLFCLLLWLLAAPLYSSPNQLEQANQSYQKGEQAATLLEREQAFNQALTQYTNLLAFTSAPSHQLLKAIGDCYFQLGEYPWAILYYYKALKVAPRDPILLERLQISGKHVGLNLTSSPFTAWQRMLLQSVLPIGGLLNSLLILVLLSFISLSFLIWSFHPLIKKLSLVLCMIILLLLFNLMLNFYFSPIEGILVNSTGYYREPDVQQAQLTSLPLKAGSKMQILASDKQGRWFKTADANGLIGYIPASAIRII